jgi:hypothetical protein
VAALSSSYRIILCGAGTEMPESLPRRGREHRLGRFALRDQHGQGLQRRLGVRRLA